MDESESEIANRLIFSQEFEIRFLLRIHHFSGKIQLFHLHYSLVNWIEIFLMTKTEIKFVEKSFKSIRTSYVV